MNWIQIHPFKRAADLWLCNHNPPPLKRQNRLLLWWEELQLLLRSTELQAMELINVQCQNNIAAVHEAGSIVAWTKGEKSKYNAFQGEGCQEGELWLHIDSTVESVFLPSGKLPAMVYNSMLDHLHKLQSKKIAPVDGTSAWAIVVYYHIAMLVLNKSLGKQWICIDPKPLNIMLRQCNYPLPSIDDIFSELSKTRLFKTLWY